MERAIDFEALTPDQLEQVLGAAERRIARLRWLQVQAIRSAMRRQVPLGDGCRTAAEWIRGRVDTTTETARSLEAVADLDEAALDRVLEEGIAGFDRVAEAAKASSTDLAPHLDIAGMRRVATRRHRITRDQEIANHGTRSVTYQRDLFGAVGHLRADGPALDTDQIYGAIRDAADRLPRPPRPEPRAAREFDGLLALALSRGEPSDESATAGDRRPIATVFIDAAEATASDGEAGAWTAAGSRVGPNALERILCDGVVELTAVTADGTPLAVGTARSAIPPRTRRHVLARRRLRRRRVYLDDSSPTASHQTEIAARRQSSRQSRHILLVPSPRRDPRARVPRRPRLATPASAIPPTGDPLQRSAVADPVPPFSRFPPQPDAAGVSARVATQATPLP